MIYFTGDMHGDRKRFNAWKLRWLGEKDALVVCGDFGFLWNGSPEEEEILQWIGKRRYQVLFLEGTHDNLDLLERYPVEEWNGGLTHRITGNLRHLIRGQIFSIQGKSLLALGGGESRDAAFRRAGENWWPQELPGLEPPPGGGRGPGGLHSLPPGPHQRGFLHHRNGLRGHRPHRLYGPAPAKIPLWPLVLRLLPSKPHRPPQILLPL